jgi:hypothetical protein
LRTRGPSLLTSTLGAPAAVAFAYLAGWMVLALAGLLLTARGDRNAPSHGDALTA